ncbi:MAG TPA: hypothetical protein VFI02_19400 [Armatimonadota bacterium]|nr:hypothetical protein [Armatimonadota bacterium]
MRRIAYLIILGSLLLGLACPMALTKSLDAAAMAGATPDIASWFDTAILLCWNQPKHTKHADIIEYHVWRDSLQTFPVLVLDSISSPAFMGFDHSAVDTPWFRTISYLAPSPNHQELVSAVTTAPGITIGQAHQYWVSCLYRRRHGNRFSYWETVPVYAGQATCLNRPVPVSPNEYASLDDITFEWQGSGGADEYAIEVSRSPSFEREQTWVSHVHRPTSSDGTTFSVTYAGILSNAPELAGVTDGDTLYWRVGARNSEDDPGPIPAGPSPLAEGEKNTRYIYNSAESILWFTVGDDGGGPPPPPPPF